MGRNHATLPGATIRPGSVQPFAMLVLAARNSGKSYLVRELYRRNQFNRRFDVVIVVSQTLGSGFYQGFIDESRLIAADTYTPELLAALRSRQDAHREEHDTYPSALVILDDCIGQRVKHDPELEQLFCMGRHRGTSVLFVSQSPTLAMTTWRQNATHVVLLNLKGLGLDSVKRELLPQAVDQADADGACARLGLPPMRREVFVDALLGAYLRQPYMAVVLLCEEHGFEMTDRVRWFRA
jgi:hypothetical protein